MPRRRYRDQIVMKGKDWVLVYSMGNPITDKKMVNYFRKKGFKATCVEDVDPETKWEIRRKKRWMKIVDIFRKKYSDEFVFIVDNVKKEGICDE